MACCVSSVYSVTDDMFVAGSVKVEMSSDTDPIISRPPWLEDTS